MLIRRAAHVTHTQYLSSVSFHFSLVLVRSARKETVNICDGLYFAARAAAARLLVCIVTKRETMAYLFGRREATALSGVLASTERNNPAVSR